MVFRTGMAAFILIVMLLVAPGLVSAANDMSVIYGMGMVISSIVFAVVTVVTPIFDAHYMGIMNAIMEYTHPDRDDEENT